MAKPNKNSFFIYDLEVFKDLFMISWADPETGETGVWVRIGADTEFSWQEIIDELPITGRIICGFNNHGYDDIILKNIAFRGKTTVGAIAKLNDFIFRLRAEHGFGAMLFPREIEEAVFNEMQAKGKTKWDFFNALDPHIDCSVDLMTLFGRTDEADKSNSAGGMGLKIIAARMGVDWIKDLPYLPDKPLGDEAKIQEVIEYGKNDIAVTLKLFDKLKDGIIAREAMAEKYGVDRKRLLQKKDAQMAEEILIETYCRQKGVDRATLKKEKSIKNSPTAHKEIRYFDVSNDDPKRPVNDDGPGIVDEPRIREMMKPDGVVAGLLAEMKGKRITRVDADDKDEENKKEGYRHGKGISEEIKIGQKVYAFKLGGLHSIDEAGITYAREGEHIIDLDAGSYYPNLILGLERYPEHLGTEILDVYNRLMVDRLEAKKKRKDDPVAANIEKGAKIALNSTFGKFKEKYSLLYDPRMTYSVTVNGQLYLLILIERMEDAGIEVISANTDGITIRCKTEDKQKALDIAEQWRQEVTRDRPRMVMALDITEYKVIIRRDVNSYVAIGLDGKIEKFKGSFCPVDLTHNPKFPIIQKAVINYIVDGTPYIETIRQSDNVHDFLIIHKASKGHVLDNDGETKDYQSTARWYLQKDSKISLYHKNNKGGLISTPYGQGIGLLEQLASFDRARVDEEHYVAMCEDFYVQKAAERARIKAEREAEKARIKAEKEAEKARIKAEKAQASGEKETDDVIKPKRGRKKKAETVETTAEEPAPAIPDINQLLETIKKQEEEIAALKKLVEKTKPLTESGMNVVTSSFGKKAGDYRRGRTDNVLVKTLLENDIDFNELSRKEIEIDLNGDGSYEYKVNVESLKWFKTSSDGTDERRGLNFLGHLSSIRPGITVPIVSVADANLALKAYEEEKASKVKHAQKMWDEATKLNERNLSDGQKRRKAILERYLKNRGFEEISKTMASVIRFATPSIPERERGAAVVMLNPMYGYEGKYAGKIIGVQRTFINENGIKLDRKMFGVTGVTFIGDMRCDTILIGEGLETVTSGLNDNHSAIICYNANNMVNFAKSIYANKSDDVEEFIQGKNDVWVLADNDFKTKVGQKAATETVRWLRESGIAARFVLPDASLVSGQNDKGIDWNDVLKEKGWKITSDLMRLAAKNSDDAMNAEVPEAEKLRALMPVREAENKKELITCGPLDFARKRLDEVVRELIFGFINTGEITPHLIKVTTGTGKSATIKKYMKYVADSDKSGLLITTETYEQAEEYVNVLPGRCALYHGRTSNDKSPAYCPAYDEMIKIIEKNHIPMNSYCPVCPNGLKYQTLFADDMETRLRAKEKLANMGIVGEKYDDLETCRWLNHRKQIEMAQVVISVDAAVSDATRIYRPSPEIRPELRLHIVDERATKTKNIVIKSSDINAWIQSIDRSIRYLQNLDDEKNPLYRIRDDIIRALEAVREAFIKIAEYVAANIDKVQARVSMSPEIMEAIERAIDLAKRIGDASNKNRDPESFRYRKNPLDRNLAATAPWEKVLIKNGAVLSAPLRALVAIAVTLKITGDIHIHNGDLNAYEITPITAAIAAGDPIIVLDATADKATSQMFKNHEIIDLRVRQNIKVIRHPDRYFGVGQFRKEANPEKRKRALGNIKKVIDYHLGLDHVVLTHKCVVEELGLTDNENIGWFGAHHRAHDRWSGKHIAIIGASVPNPASWAKLYESDRIAALACGADPDLWPEYDGELEEGCWINEGQCEVQSRIALPKNIFIREWFLDFMTNETVQAIGRVRGVNHAGKEPLEVHIYGGVPLYGIWNHGIEIAEYVSDRDVLGLNKAQYMGKYQDLRKKALRDAANEMIVKQELISRDRISELMKERTGQGLGSQTYQAFYNDVAPELAHHFVKAPKIARALEQITCFDDERDAKKFLDSLRRLAKRGNGDVMLGASKVKEIKFKHALRNMKIFEVGAKHLEDQWQAYDEKVAAWILNGQKCPPPKWE